MENTKTNLVKLEREIKGALTRPLHLRLEYFFRQQYCLIVVLLLMTLAVVKSDGRLMAMMREAYAQGYGMISAYLREETTRTPVAVVISRTPSITSK